MERSSRRSREDRMSEAELHPGPGSTGRKLLLLITHLDSGGAQETVISLAQGLSSQGLGVTVAARPEGALAGRLDDTGARFLAVNAMQRAVAPRADASAYRELRSLIRGGDYDVVHTHSSKAGVLGRTAARRAGVPAIVHTSHGLPINPDMRPAERRLLLAAERFAARRSDSIVAVSHATARELIDLRLARSDQITVIPSGVNVRQETRPGDRSAARERLGLPASAPVAGWVGRHFDQKRPEQICAIARRVTGELDDAHVVLVGDGPELEASRAACAGQGRIHVLGYRDDVDAIYEALDVMYLASAWEGLPRTILEAMAAGVPVVSTDVSGVSEVVREGETGFLVPTDQPEIAADRIIDLLLDRTLVKRLGVEARATITREYSTTFMIEATVKLYENLLSR